MGKQKRERRKPHKENPTGLTSVKDFEGEDDLNDRKRALDVMYEQVQSPNIEEKLSGLQTLESMSCDSVMAGQISQNEITKIVGSLLVDHNVPVRAAAASALRHVAENGAEEACANLLRNDIMTPLSTLLKQFYTEWQPKNTNKEKGKLDDDKETLIQAVTLLWTLCENNETIIKYSNEADLLSLLLKFLDITVYGMDIGTVVAQCMLSLSEDNLTAIKTLKQYEDLLLNLLNLEIKDDTTTSDTISLKTCIAGLLMNVISKEDNSMSTVCKIVTVLSDTLSIDHKNLLNNLVSILPHEKNAYSSTARKKVHAARNIFGAQQQTLEILANLCSEDQDSDSCSDLNESDEAEDEFQCIDDDPMNDNKLLCMMPLELVEVFGSREIIKKVWEKTVAVDEGIQEILEQNVEGKAVLKQIHTLRCRAYLCLNNLISNLDIDTLGGVNDVYRAWVEIGTLVFKDANPNDIEILESATAVMRASLQKLADIHADVFNNLTLLDIQPMLSGERQCSNANVRANLVRILGNLALILANKAAPEHRELVKHISIFLLETCTAESEAWVMAEILDAIMDIYAEDETDNLAEDIQLVRKLHSLLPLFKNKVRLQKKHLRDNASIISTVNGNLMNFIRYKEKRLKKLKKGN